MAIEFEVEEYENGSVAVLSVAIDGEKFDSEDSDCVPIPKRALANVHVADLDERFLIQPIDRFDEGILVIDTVPFTFRKIDENRVRVEFDELLRRKFWDGHVGLGKYMETKRQVIEERAAATKDVQVSSYEDDGDYIALLYTAEFAGDCLKEIIQQAEQLASEIEGGTDIALGSPFKRASECENEREFTLSVVIPLLRKLGFTNVKYNHGKREFGKDVIFARLTEFDEYERWGAQVKFGDISGSVRSAVDDIISQADDGFKMPFYDVYTREQARISKLLIAISGKFTENAVEKICEKIESHAVKNNMIFLDGERIEALAERIRLRK